MATTLILPPATAIEAATIALRNGADTKRLIALNKAEYDLVVLRPQIVRVQHAFLIPSTSRGGVVHRLDDVVGCDCEAGRAGRTCRHAVALEIIEHAQMHTMPALAPRASDEAYAQACAAMDELYA